MWGLISLWFQFAFPWWSIMLSTFSLSLGLISIYLLWENIYLVCWPILKSDYLTVLLLSCMSSLYILNFNPLSNIWFSKIFSQSIGCFLILIFFCLLPVPWEALQFDVVHFLTLASAACAFGITFKKSFPRPTLGSFPPMFSYELFIISELMFKSLTHFELTLVSAVR